MKQFFKFFLRLIPYVKFLETEYENSLQIPKEIGHRPGHFYSTIPSHEDILINNNRDYAEEEILNVELNYENQVKLINELKNYYNLLPYDFNKNIAGYRYFPVDAYYRYSDVVFLFTIINYFKPKQIIEIGSGHSSAVMLDTNELFFKNSIKHTFIEPFQENRLNNMLREFDRKEISLIKTPVQKTDINLFKELNENDILFVDSSHVSKLGSDLNHIIFKILPSLKPGVLIHFHDVFFPFELPKHWINERYWYWNENYLLRAFLMNNKDYEIVIFNSMLHQKMPSWFSENMPICLKGVEDTGSIWIRKKK